MAPPAHLQTTNDVILSYNFSRAGHGLTLGILWCVILRRNDEQRAKLGILFDFKISVETVRTLNSNRIPLAVYTNLSPGSLDAPGKLRQRPGDASSMLWTWAKPSIDSVPAAGRGSMIPMRQVYLHKLRALATTPFEQTVYLDTDVVLLRRDFVQSMRWVAEVSDLAMPLDPNRDSPFDMVPMGCSCVMVYRRCEATLQLFERASALLREGSRQGVRQSDQEMLYLAWREAPQRLRVLLLPEEFYCFSNNGSSEWQSAHRTYACWAAHDHSARNRLSLVKELKPLGATAEEAGKIASA